MEQCHCVVSSSPITYRTDVAIIVDGILSTLHLPALACHHKDLQYPGTRPVSTLIILSYVLLSLNRLHCHWVQVQVQERVSFH